MADDVGIAFFAELFGMGVEAIADTHVFSSIHHIVIGIKNNTYKSMKLAYSAAVDSRYESPPTSLLVAGGHTFVVVKPPEGVFNANFHMEADFYYNKTDKDEAFFRCHVVNNMTSANDWSDTKPWHDCKFEKFEVKYGAAKSMMYVGIVVVDA